MHSLSTRFTPRIICWRLAWLFLGFGVADGSVSLHAQSIINGSFEDPSTATQFQGAGTGWSSGNSVFVYNNGAGAGTTSVGSQWLYLSNHNSATQTVSGLSVDTVYHFSLECADVTGTADSFDVTLSGGVSFTDFITIPARAGGASAGALPFTTYGFNFTPTSATVIITLQDLSTTPVAVDNVVLTSPVPELGAEVWVTLGGVIISCVQARRCGRLKRVD